MKNDSMHQVKTIMLVICAAGALWAGSLWAKDNLDYWLGRSQEAPDTQNAATEDEEFHPIEPENQPPPDSPPGAIELSDGRQLGGWLVTTRGKPWLVWEQQTNQWRRIPPLAVLSIVSEVVEEKMEQSWRWKGMGTPQRVYSGEQYPVRRLRWRFNLADGSNITGIVKGQPLSIWHDGKLTGPFVLHERMRGQDGHKLDDPVFIRKIVVSDKMMRAVLNLNNCGPTD